MKSLVIFIALIPTHFLFAGNDAHIAEMSGEVKVRRGLDEHWQAAKPGLDLDALDTILTGEKGEVRLSLDGDVNFTLGANAILDISDLRRISRQELFLIITSEKIESLPPRRSPGSLHINNVNVLHGAKKTDTGRPKLNSKIEREWQQHRNGGIDLLQQDFYTNAIIKFHKTLKTYVQVKDCGEIYFYLGQAFEALENEGQALEAYSNSISENDEQACQDAPSAHRREKSEKALQRLKR
ncbi:MAG: hypothetical protein DWQ10_05860 [Calditrichaeota bacterium]|nr:MAG: hypothetical protein DWQ10_05860 [Calditrichota bacterium]